MRGRGRRRSRTKSSRGRCRRGAPTPRTRLPMRNDRSLTPQQINTLVAWVDGGSPRGSDADMPAAPKFAEGWTYGREPDLVLEMPADFDIPAEGELRLLKTSTSKVPFDDGQVRAGRGTASGQSLGRASCRRSTSPIFPTARRSTSTGRIVQNGQSVTTRAARCGRPDAAGLVQAPVVRPRPRRGRRTATMSASGFPPANTSTGRFTTARPASLKTIARGSASGSTRCRSSTRS